MVSHSALSSIGRTIGTIVGISFVTLTSPALADDHLVPGAQIVSGYETSVSGVLKGAFTDDLDALSIVEPSFEPEFAVGTRVEGGHYRVFYLVAKEQVWANLIQNKPLRSIGTNYSEYEISAALGTRIARVWDAMLRDIGPDPHPPSVLDGSNYYFSKRVDGALRIGMSWDQRGGTKTGRLQEIDYLIRDLCVHRDAQLVDQLSSKVAELLKLLLPPGSAVDAANRIWKAVPDHRGVFVDTASIVHLDVSGVPYRHCVAGGPPDSCDPPPFDTKADIKVDGAMSEGTGFWCSTPNVEMGDLHFGVAGGEDHIIPVVATKLIVCGPQR